MKRLHLLLIPILLSGCTADDAATFGRTVDSAAASYYRGREPAYAPPAPAAYPMAYPAYQAPATYSYPTPTP